jgi:hypothetical protein
MVSILPPEFQWATSGEPDVKWLEAFIYAQIAKCDSPMIDDNTNDGGIGEMNPTPP